MHLNKKWQSRTRTLPEDRDQKGIYKPFRYVAKARRTKPSATSQKEIPLKTGIETKLAMIPKTPAMTATHQVIFFGAFNFI
jgi:hypothetical protein